MNFLNPVENPGGFTAFIVLFSVGVTVAAFVWRGKWAATLGTGGMKGGTPGTGVITGIGQTGVYINNLPQMTFDLQVSVNGQAPYAAQVKQTVPLAVLGMLAPGRTVAVVVDPQKPSKVKLDLNGTAAVQQVAAIPGATSYATAPAPAMAGMATAPAPAAAGSQVRSNDELVATGEPVAVTVVSAQDTGQFYGPDPIVLLHLDVHAPAGTYQITVGHRIPADKRAKVVPGTVLRGALDPNERNAVGIDWRALL